MIFADIIAKAENVIRQILIQNPDRFVCVFQLLIKGFISSFGLYRRYFWVRDCSSNVLVDLLEHEQVITKLFVTNQTNVPIHLLNRRLVIFCEISRNTDQAGHCPVNIACLIQSKFFYHKHFETILVIQQPIKVKESLINNIFFQ